MKKSDSTSPKLKILYDGLKPLSASVETADNNIKFTIESGNHQSNLTEMPCGKYSVKVGDKKITDVILNQGGMYILMLEGDSTNMTSQLLTVVKPNSVNMLWQIPQYIIITAAEIMFSITGIEFSYSESPDSMKSVLSSVWLLTDSFGNIIVLIVAGFKMANEATEMFMYAGLMAVIMLLFIYLARQYTNSKKRAKEEDENDTRLEDWNKTIL